MKNKLAVLVLIGSILFTPKTQAWAAGAPTVRRTSSEVLEISTTAGQSWCSIVNSKKVAGTFSASKQTFTTLQDQISVAKSKLKSAKQKKASSKVILKLSKALAKLKALLKVAGPACLAANVPQPVSVDPTPAPATPTPRPTSAPSCNASAGATVFANRCAACHSVGAKEGRSASQIQAAIQSQPEMMNISLSSSDLAALVCFLNQ